jgi:hypothetical protein
MKSLAVVLAPVLLLAACASSQQRTVNLLERRLEARLQPDIAAGRATVQPMPGASRVTLLDDSRFSTGTMALDDKYPDPRSNVIEGMLDPSLMQVQITDTSNLPEEQRDERVRNVAAYFAANGLGAVLSTADPASPAASPAGLAITIGVMCPSNTDSYGYGSGRSTPACY